MEIVGRHQGSNFRQSKAERALAASLVHDIGHGPFSHAFEDAARRIGIEARRALLTIAVTADPIELELAATAAFLSKDHVDPWEETAKRKPQKAEGQRLDKARALYEKLLSIHTPSALPRI